MLERNVACVPFSWSLLLGVRSKFHVASPERGEHLLGWVIAPISDWIENCGSEHHSYRAFMDITSQDCNPALELGDRLDFLSAGRPGHWAAAQKMEMDVIDDLAGVLPSVQNEPIATSANRRELSQLGARLKHLGYYWEVLRGAVRDAWDVLPRDDEYMRWGLRIYIMESYNILVAVNDASLHFGLSYLAENTVSHGAS